MKRIGLQKLSIGIIASTLIGCRGAGGSFIPPSGSNAPSSDCTVLVTASGTSSTCPQPTQPPVLMSPAPRATSTPLPIFTPLPAPITPQPTLAPTPAPTSPPSQPSPSVTGLPVTLSFYSFADNGNSTQIYYPLSQGYPSVHNAAGGSGTYSDPLTMAASKAVFSPGTKLYVYALSKYVVMEDYCGVCENDWSWSQKRDVQVWIGGDSTNSTTTLAQCEGILNTFVSQSSYAGLVLPNPPAGLLVNTTPLFNASTGACY